MRATQETPQAPLMQKLTSSGCWSWGVIFGGWNQLCLSLNLTHLHATPCPRSVEIVSEAFQGKPLVARHRLVYTLLKEELDAGLHALALKTKTPSEVAR